MYPRGSARPERRYSVPPPSTLSDPTGRCRTTEDLHAWSIYRQNLNSDFTDSALGSSERSPPPFGDFRLRDSTVHTIITHPKYGPRDHAAGASIYNYLRFGLPRVFPQSRPPVGLRNGSSGYDSSEDGSPFFSRHHHRSQSHPDFRTLECPRHRHVPPAPLPTVHRGLRSGGSHLSIASRLRNTHLPEMEEDCPLPRYPHLQVRDLHYELDRSSWSRTLCGGARTKLRMLEGLSFESRGGEILGILPTSEEEGTAILDILANRHRRWRCRVRGDFIVNGLALGPEALARCVAYVPRGAAPWPDMSVRQALLFASLLQEPDLSRGFDIKPRINALIEELELGPIRHTRVRDLTPAEKRRVVIACQLLLDTDIVLLDQPIRGLDILDALFLVDLLRRWASRGRTVVMTIQPPTYEIFNMLSRVALVSTGRMLYFGRRREMLTYFSYLNYPCPSFKNPADYYLDLVTLDTLSAEALLESTQRVEELVATFRQQPCRLSDPGPPAVPLAAVRKAGLLSQIMALWIRVMIYMFPFNVISFCLEVFLASLFSVLVGAAYWNLRAGRDQADAMDRMAFYYVMVALAPWPSLMLALSHVWKEKEYVEPELAAGLYSRFTFVICKLSYSSLVAGLVGVALAVPAYSMAGLQTQSRVAAFGVYVGYLVLYLLTLRLGALAIAWGCGGFWRVGGALLAATSCLLAMPPRPAGNSSPTHWALTPLLAWEFSAPDRFLCPRNPVLNQENTILVKAECGFYSSEQVLRFYNQPAAEPEDWVPLAALSIFHAIFAILAILAFRYGQSAWNTKSY